jgi:low affinity Fe/Cu permease
MRQRRPDKRLPQLSTPREPRQAQATATHHWTTDVGQAAGHPAAFLVVLLYAVLWLTFSPRTFEWNAVATLAVFIMTLFIQRANRRDNLALHAKLDELLRVDGDARSELTQLDEQEPEEIEQHRDEEVRKAGA